MRTREEILERASEFDVLCISNLWRDDLLTAMPLLKLVQATSSGTDQFPLAMFQEQGVLLASSRGLNAQAVAEQVMGYLFSIARQLYLARDRQGHERWRFPVGERASREFELKGQRMHVIGFGSISREISRLAQALEMEVAIFSGHVAQPEWHGQARCLPMESLAAHLPQARFVVLANALTPHSRGMVNRGFLSRMAPEAWLVNVSRGAMVDAEALTAALRDGWIAGAALDCFDPEPLSPGSPLWKMENVIITSHSAGESAALEARIIDVLIENVRRIQAGDFPLVNQIVGP
ncbi:phosphoglycerate dehydrogenase [Verticiella sediminum]